MAADRAVAYLRVSTQAQTDGASLDVQERDIRAHCAKHGYDLVQVIPEVATGHDSMTWRPALKQARSVLRAKQANALLVWKFDRVARDSTSNLVLHRETTQTGAYLESVQEGRVQPGPQGRWQLFMYGESADMEHSAIKLRTREALRKRVADGMPLVGRHPLYGFRYVYGPGKRIGTLRKVGYELEDETAAVVRACYHKVADEGYSLHALARWLNNNGVLTPTAWLQTHGMLKPGARVATTWSRQMLYNLLVNESYCGRHVVNKRVLVKDEDIPNDEKPRKVMRMRPIDDPERVVLTIPAVVSPELWQRAQVAMAAHKAESKRRNADPDATLLRAGFAVCGHCGAPMASHIHRDRTRPNERPYRVYRCVRRKSMVDGAREYCSGGEYGLKADLVDRDTWEKVCDIARDSDRLQRLLESRHRKSQDALDEVVREGMLVAAETAELEAQLSTLKRRLATEQDDMMYAMLKDELKRVNGALVAAQQRRKVTVIQAGKYVAVIASIRDLAERMTPEAPRTPEEFAAMASNDPLATMTYGERRELLRLLGVKVRMYASNSDYVRETGKRWEFTFEPCDSHSDTNPV